jgi:O-antigen/teichoic acid export membrane protein
MSGFYKALSGLALFVSIPVLIHYLGNTSYGVWVLVFTLFQWVLLMDFGLSSVLKTKIPELQHTGNTDLINAYVKSTYKICSYIALGIFLLFVLLFAVFDVKNLLNIELENGFVIQLFLLNIFFFCINFVLNTHKALFVSVHKGKFAEQSIAVTQVSFLILLVLTSQSFPTLAIENKLYLVSFVNGFVSLLINLIYTLFFFKREKFSFKTKLETPKEYLKSIYRLGMKYMAIQVGGLILFSSDNYILAYFFGPEEIVPYEVVSKYFQFPLMILLAGMAPLWSKFTKHYLERDAIWIKNAFRKFNYFFIVILIGVVLFTLLARPVMTVWISKDFNPPLLLLIFVAVMTALRIFTAFYGYFFNGIGNLRSYLLLLSGSVLIKLPLSYLFIKLDFGISSVVIASCCCLLIWSFVQPMEAYKIVSDLKKHE